MRPLTFSLITASLLIFASSFTNCDSDKKSIDNKETVEVIFNRKLEFNDIVKIKLNLAQKGIVINYKKLEFDKEGKLLCIDFHVDCKDGFSGGASQRNLTNQSRFGFYRNYAPVADSPFGTGNL